MTREEALDELYKAGVIPDKLDRNQWGRIENGDSKDKSRGSTSQRG